MSEHIPRDIMIQILELSPVGSLVRLRCVCKWMNQFIDSSSFIQDHLALQKPRFIAVHKGREFIVVNPASTPSMVSALFARSSESERVNLVGTLHGIVCFYYCNSHVMLCNLSIRKCLNLPLPDFKKFRFMLDDSDDNDDTGYVEHHNDSFCVFPGFWIDPSSKDFKIVIFQLLEPDLCSVNHAILYSSIEQDWEAVSPGARIRRYPSFTESPAIVMGEKGYWRASQVYEKLDEAGNPWLCTIAIVVSFDFEMEYFGMINAPYVGYTLLYPPVLSRWQDTLSLVFVDQENSCEIYLWNPGEEEEEYTELEENLLQEHPSYHSWIKRLSFNLTTISRVLSVVESQGEDTDLAGELLENRRILATSSNELVLYDNGSSYITLKSGLEDMHNFSVAYDYVGSLLFPRYFHKWL